MIERWMRRLLPAVIRREEDETRTLYREVKRQCARHPFATDEAWGTFVCDLIVDICAARDVTPTIPLASALWDAIRDFAHADEFRTFPILDDPPPHLTMEEGLQLRETLRRTQRFLADHERLLPIWRTKLVYLFAGLLQYFPPSAFTDIDERGMSLDDSVVFPSAKALDLCENLPEVLDRSIVTLCDADVVTAHLFDMVRERMETNACVASGLRGPPTDESAYKIILPGAHKNRSPEFLADAYLRGTPLEGFFNAPLPFAIPFPAKFEHTHCVGGTGHGKTQLLQFLIHHDLVRSQEDGRSIVVLDSQGDLIRTISRLKYFSPDADKSLADRFVMIDPQDIAHPVALNMFDFNRSRLSAYAPVDQEKILNATIELFDYFFGALLGAELTQRQGLIFRYIARLMIEIPGATIHTLRELMEDGEKFLPHMEKLTGTTRAFFATRFFEKQFSETKKQILARLWGVLSNASLERMFSHKESKIDMFDLLNSGKIIFVNTAKSLLGQDGAAIFGRFFIALIGQAAIQRAAIPAHERRPAFVYIDEAQDYFDANISNLLNQARKYKIGLLCAHQSLSQLSTELRGSVFASTTIKFAGGVSAQDAKPFADELRCDSDFVLAQKRGKTHTKFACFVKNFTARALSVDIPLGFVESLPTLSAEDEAALLEKNRAAYCAPPEIVAEVPFTFGKEKPKKEKKETAKEKQKTDAAPAKEAEPTPVPETPKPLDVPLPPPREPQAPPSESPRAKPAPPTPGRGGQEHKRLQYFVKQLAEDRGYRASIEETILSGSGQVDVSLFRGKERIACEITVTTSRDHELGNVEKCIAAGYRHILLIGRTAKQIAALGKFIERNLDDGSGARIDCVAEDDLPAYLDGLGLPPPSESTVRGIKVKRSYTQVSPEERALQRQAIARVALEAAKRGKEGSEGEPL